MMFRMSPNIAVRTQKQFSQAVDFYSGVLGFQNRSEDPELGDLDASPINLYILEDDELSGPVMELFVDDLEKARRGKGQDCYIQDPFGVIFNLWEE